MLNGVLTWICQSPQEMQFRCYLRALKAQIFSPWTWIQLGVKILWLRLLFIRWLNFCFYFWFCIVGWRNQLFPFRSSPPILEPVIDIGFRNLAMLAEFRGYVFDLLLAWSSIPLIKDSLQNLKLYGCWSPPLSGSHFVPTRCHQWVTIQISQPASCNSPKTGACM